MKLFLGLGCAIACLSLAGCHGSSSSGPGGSPSGSADSTLTELKKDDVKVGTGETAEVGDTAYLEYTGSYANGAQFDSNMPADEAHPEKAPLSFFLTKDHATVIDGWNLGVRGMKVGGERKLSIPWALGYGANGKPGSIPPKSDLYFDIKLIALLKAGKDTVLGEKDLKVGTGPEVKAGDWVTISYVATIENGMRADASADHPPALQFQAGTGDAGNDMVVPAKGIVKGVIGMKLGGERMLLCPPQLATAPGARSSTIPSDSIFTYDVKLLRVSSKKEPDMEEPKS